MPDYSKTSSRATREYDEMEFERPQAVTAGYRPVKNVAVDASLHEQYIKSLSNILDIIAETQEVVNAINYRLFGPQLEAVSDASHATPHPIGDTHITRNKIDTIASDLITLRQSLNRFQQL